MEMGGEPRLLVLSIPQEWDVLHLVFTSHYNTIVSGYLSTGSFSYSDQRAALNTAFLRTTAVCVLLAIRYPSS